MKPHKAPVKEEVKEEPILVFPPPYAPGMIDLREDSERELCIPAHQIRNLRFRNTGKKNEANSFVLGSSKDSDYTLIVIHPVNTDRNTLKQIFAAALAGQDFDLRAYSGPRPKRLHSFEDLPEIRELRAQEAKERAEKEAKNNEKAAENTAASNTYRRGASIYTKAPRR